MAVYEVLSHLPINDNNLHITLQVFQQDLHVQVGKYDIRKGNTRKHPLEGFNGIELVCERPSAFRPLVSQNALGCGFDQISQDVVTLDPFPPLRIAFDNIT